MAGINLIPKQPSDNKQVAQITKFLKIGSILTLILLAVVGGAVLSVSFYFSNQLQEEAGLQKSLKTEIENLESVETVMLLMKDRAQKAQTILQSRNTESKYLVFKNIVQDLSGDVALEEIKLDETQIAFEISASNSQELSKLLTDALSQVEDGQTLTLVEVDYSYFTDYSSNFVLQ